MNLYLWMTALTALVVLVTGWKIGLDDMADASGLELLGWMFVVVGIALVGSLLWPLSWLAVGMWAVAKSVRERRTRN